MSHDRDAFGNRVFDDDVPLFTAEWYRRNREAHLAEFPDLDQVSRDNLDAFVRNAEARA